MGPKGQTGSKTKFPVPLQSANTHIQTAPNELPLQWVLTLTSSPSECLQCSLNLGNTLSLRALRSATLSVQNINTNRKHLQKTAWSKRPKITCKTLLLFLVALSHNSTDPLASWIINILYHVGWSRDRFSHRTSCGRNVKANSIFLWST